MVEKEIIVKENDASTVVRNDGGRCGMSVGVRACMQRLC